MSLPDEIKFTETLRSASNWCCFPSKAARTAPTLKIPPLPSRPWTPPAPWCLCIRYLRLDGKPVTEKNRSVICWYKGVNFLKYYWNLMARRLEAELSFLDPVEYDPERNRGELAELVYEQVRDTFNSYDTQLST